MRRRHEDAEGSGMKPTVKLVGEDGNVFNIIGLVCRALKDGTPDIRWQAQGVGERE